MIKVRGLPLIKTRILQLLHGKIPHRLFDLALSVMLIRPEREVYTAIVWNEGYQLYVPEQSGDSGRVTYQAAENVVVELHSHCDKGMAFSLIDNADEQGFKIYGVVGDLYDESPSLNLRLGVYGYFYPLHWGDVFDGEPGGVNDKNELMGECPVCKTLVKEEDFVFPMNCCKECASGFLKPPEKEANDDRLES